MESSKNFFEKSGERIRSVFKRDKDTDNGNGRKSGLGSGDFWLVIFTLILVIFGLIMVFSASYYYSISRDGSAYSYLIRQGLWILVGFGFMILGAVIDYRKYKKFAVPFAIFTLILLALLFTPLGTEVNGATRWISVGPIAVMPGEWAKLAVIMLAAMFLSSDPNRIKSVVRGILPLLGVAVVFGGMIIMQPNLSTAITVVVIIIAMMLIAGMKWRYVIGAGCVGAAGVASIILFMKDSYWYTRLTSFTDPFADALGDGYQAVQSLLALGSGGILGVGLGKSVQKNLYLPEPQNDFIMAIIGEELGFVGLLALIVLYCLFIWRGTHIAINAPDQFGLLMAAGIVVMIAVEVILNIAVVTSSMPATGINLPFISYGGNALIICMFCAGILINISRHKPKGNQVTSTGAKK